MADRFSDRSPDRPSARSGYDDGAHFWECIVSDGEEWHFIRVLGVELGPSTDLTSEDIEDGIEGFAATLPDSYRLRALLNTNPLHVDRSGTVSD